MNIRRAALEDAADIAKVQVTSWQQSYIEIVDAEYLAEMSIEVRTNRWKEWLSQGNSHIVLVLEDEDQKICGFISGGRNRSEHPYDCEVYAFYLLKSVQRKRFGTLLLKEFVRQLLSEGKESMVVWVLKENPAKQAYISLDGKKIDEELIKVGNQELCEECYAWHDLSTIV